MGLSIWTLTIAFSGGQIDHVLYGLSILGHSPGLNPHGHLDINLELLNLSDLSVGLLNDGGVFGSLYLAMEIFQQCFEVLQNLGQHLHVCTNVTLQLCEFLVFLDNLVGPFSLNLEFLLQLLNLACAMLKLCNPLVDIHAESIEIIDPTITLL